LITAFGSVLVLGGCTAMEGLLGGPEDEPTAFSTYDDDRSGLIEPAEFDRGFYEEDVFADADEDGDGLLDEEEFASLGTDDDFGVFDDDGDGVLSEDEFGAGIFESWDVDDDGFLEQAEWNDNGFFG
jgi:Ca2+-binding EF-hand superfamily protein